MCNFYLYNGLEGMKLPKYDFRFSCYCSDSCQNDIRSASNFIHQRSVDCQEISGTLKFVIPGIFFNLKLQP